MSKLPAWATGMALGEALAEQFIEQDDFWAEMANGSEYGTEGVTCLWQNLMKEVMMTMSKSTDFLEEIDDEDNPAKGLLPA
jgi:hypothetical protein